MSNKPQNKPTNKGRAFKKMQRSVYDAACEYALNSNSNAEGSNQSRKSMVRVLQDFENLINELHQLGLLTLSYTDLFL